MAKDYFHYHVKEALEKEGWLITHDPYRLQVLDSPGFEIDLGAEKNVIGAEKGNLKIAIEIKSFLEASFAYEFHKVLGQYLNYLTFLENKEPNRRLYLAISLNTFEQYFTHEFTNLVLKKYNIHLLIFDPDAKIILKWIEN